MQLKGLRFKVGSVEYFLRQNDADSQVWMIDRVSPCGRAGPQSDSTGEQESLGVLCVYVDDFLVMAPAGPVRDAMIQALTSLWEFGPERTLSEDTGITFLGIDWSMQLNGDIRLSQERFSRELLEKHGWGLTAEAIRELLVLEIMAARREAVGLSNIKGESNPEEFQLRKVVI